jgi:hypothetical protein
VLARRPVVGIAHRTEMLDDDVRRILEAHRQTPAIRAHDFDVPPCKNRFETSGELRLPCVVVADKHLMQVSTRAYAKKVEMFARLEPDLGGTRGLRANFNVTVRILLDRCRTRGDVRLRDAFDDRARLGHNGFRASAPCVSPSSFPIPPALHSSRACQSDGFGCRFLLEGPHSEALAAKEADPRCCKRFKSPLRPPLVIVNDTLN